MNTKFPISGKEFRCVLTDPNGLVVNSDSASLLIVPNPLATISVLGDTVCYNDSYAYVKIIKPEKGYIYTASYTSSQDFSVYSSDTAKSDTLSLRFIVESMGSGTKKIIVTADNNGCVTQLSDTARVSVYFPPSGNTTFTGSTVCEGIDSALVTLQGTVFGARYRAFYNGNPISNYINGTGKIDKLFAKTNSLSPTSNIIKVEANNLGCAIILSDTAIIKVLPPPIENASSNSPICVNSLLKLSPGQIVKGYTYSWTGPNKFSSNIGNPSFTAQNLGKEIYSLTITGNNNCTSLSNVAVQISPKPILNPISGPSSNTKHVQTF